MNKTIAMLLLALSGFVPALTAAFGAVRLFVTYRSGGLPLWAFSVTLLAMVHLSAFVFLQKRFKKAYDTSAPRFVLLGTLPAVLAGAVGYAAYLISALTGLGADRIGLSAGIFTVSAAMYAAGFAVLLALIFAVKQGISSLKRLSKPSDVTVYWFLPPQ